MKTITCGSQESAWESSKKNLVLSIVAMTCLAACIAEWILDSPESLNDGFIRIVYMLAVSMLPLYPVPATWGIIVIAFLNELMPCLSQCDESWGVLVSLVDSKAMLLFGGMV